MKQVLFFFSLAFLFSCNEKKEIGPEVLGYDFYPIAIGQYRIYEVEEIQYKLSGFDTSSFQLRETLFDSIVSSDQTTYLIRRDKRDDPSLEWKSDSVWTVTRTQNFLSVSENSIPFIKLTFPVKDGKEWDGNSLNAKGNVGYYYQPIGGIIIDTLAQNDHIRVVIEDIPQNLVNRDERSEVYARGIGLVQKDYVSLQFCTVDCNEIGEIEGGRSLQQILIEIGNE